MELLEDKGWYFHCKRGSKARTIISCLTGALHQVLLFTFCCLLQLMAYTLLCQRLSSARWMWRALRGRHWQLGQSFPLRSFGMAAGVQIDDDELQHLVEEARTSPKRMPRPKQSSRVLGDGNGCWRCCDCGLDFPAGDFYLSGPGKIFSYCKNCQRARSAKWRRTLRGNACLLVGNARNRSRIWGLNCFVDCDFILSKVLEQRGRCAYSGVEMELLLPHSDWRMSLERLQNDTGYEPQNCVLIAAEFNTPGKISKDMPIHAEFGSSKWSLEKVQHLQLERGMNLDLQGLHEGIEAARLRPRTLGELDACGIQDCGFADTSNHLRCAKCGCWKPLNSFYLNHKSSSGFHWYCKQCLKASNLARRLTLRGHSLKLLANAHERHRRGKWIGDFELDLNRVLDLLSSQQGRCFYSGVPLRFAQLNVDWMMSLERLDNHKTYTKDNTVLVALEFNSSDHTARATTSEVFGSGQWSRSKVEHVWGPLRALKCT